MSPRLPAAADLVLRLVLVDSVPARGGKLVAELGACLVPAPAVVEARTGRETLDVLRRSAFDIVLFDMASINDLGGSPEEAVGRLVKLAQGALTVGLTDDPSVSAAVAVMRAGVHDCVVRPIAAGELALRLNQLAQRHGKAHLFGPDAPLRQVLADIATLASASSQALGIGAMVGGSDEQQLLQQLARRLAALFDEEVGDATEEASLPAMQPAILPMWRQEQRIIEEAIASFAGNIGLAAAALELSPSTIYRKRQAWAELDASKGAA